MARRAKAVYAKRVVAPVFWGPFLVVYHARRKGFQLEVHHAVATYNHSRICATELVHYQLQCVFVGIQVVAVELYGKASAFLAFCGQFPAPAYAEVSAPWYDVHKGVCLFQAIEYLCCAVGGVVVYNNDVERKFVFCESALSTASFTVRARLRTGIITEASVSNSSFEKSTCFSS